jgi:hypothetical protein
MRSFITHQQSLHLGQRILAIWLYVTALCALGAGILHFGFSLPSQLVITPLVIVWAGGGIVGTLLAYWQRQ